MKTICTLIDFVFNGAAGCANRTANAWKTSSFNEAETYLFLVIMIMRSLPHK